MKKLIYFALPLAFVGAFFLGRATKKSFHHDNREETATQFKESLTSPHSLPTPPASISWEVLQRPSVLKLIQERFLAPYAPPLQRHSYAKEQEVMYRLSLLKKIDQLDQTKKTEEILKIYLSILDNKKEEWIVKRQALKNLNPYLHLLSEKERNRLFASLDSRVRQSALLSDLELVQMWDQNP